MDQILISLGFLQANYSSLMGESHRETINNCSEKISEGFGLIPSLIVSSSLWLITYMVYIKVNKT
jgi:hypothetical protein